MKKWGILLLAALAAAVVLSSCEGLGIAQTKDLAAYATKTDLTTAQTALANQTGVCMDCHNAVKYDVPAAKVGYEFSGHFAGTRTYAIAEGSWAMENAGSVAPTEGANTSCAKCHSDEGFKAWLGAASHPKYQTATSAVDQYNSAPVGGASPGCFTCHDPHTNKTMALRTIAAVDLSSSISYATKTAATATTPLTFNTVAYATKYDGGKGNLCANCHQDRRGVQDSLNPTIAKDASTATAADTTTATSRYLHQGPQADFMLGTDNAGVSTSTTDKDHLVATLKTNGYALSAGEGFAVSKHYTGDTCVACHVTLNDMAGANLSGAVSNHSMYLTTGSKDNVKVCLSCHTDGVATATTFRTLWTSGSKFTLFTNIDAAEKALLGYFGNPTNFYKADLTRKLVYPRVKYAVGDSATTAYSAPVIKAYANGGGVSLTDPAGTYIAGDYSYTVGTTNVRGKDWKLNETNNYLTKRQNQACWNFYLYELDRSQAIHNPTYAAQILYDAIVLLKADGATLTNPWTARP
ncbi:MAG: hypothetical protein WCQ50_01220 [Spirochaetota bacterium]